MGMKDKPNNGVRIPLELENELRSAVNEVGKNIQKDHMERVENYQNSVKSAKEGLKKLDEFLVKISKNAEKKK